MRIFLIGYMGSGKTGTAIALGKIFKCLVVDTDQLVSEKSGKAISSVFEEDGENYFREAERDALRSTINHKNVVVSTGGGTPCFHDNMIWMNENGITVYLEANPGLLFHRLATSKKGRPLIEKLDDVELMEQITGHLAVRASFYRMAKITVNAASLNDKLLAEKIKSFVNKSSA